MDILLPGGCRVPGLNFDEDGPKIDGMPLLAKSDQGFIPRPREVLDDILRKRVEGSFDSRHMHQRLAAVSSALNTGDLALAAIATSQLRIRIAPRSSLNVADMHKAEDLAEIAAGIAENNIEVDAALAFARQGPRTLEELTISGEEESFPSFEAFKKIDFEKQFEPAGDGYEYHHIVEQSSGLPLAELNSTSNIVRIPKLLHEEVNAAFSRFDEDLGSGLRQSLSGTSFERRRAAGLAVLRKLGIIQP